MRLTLPFPPSGNRYWRVYRGIVVPSAEARAYKQLVRMKCLTAGVTPIDGPVVVYASVFRPRKRGDLDNSLKVLLDAIRGTAYHDDGQVAEIYAARHDDKANPRVELRVLPQVAS